MTDRKHDELFKPMTAQSWRGTLKRMNLSPAAAARVLGITPRHARNFSNDVYEVPPVVALALRLLEKIIAPKDLEWSHSRPTGRPPKVTQEDARP